MGTVLKLGFAMGGGVSLGTFSGSSLTEIIKLHVLELAGCLRAGIPEDKWPYHDIEVDVFSGASAGCLSLALMVRGLAHRTSAEEQDAEEKLRTDPRNSDIFSWLDTASLNSPKAKLIRDYLVAIEATQSLQEKAWVDQITFEKLVPKNDASEGFRMAGGLLNHEAVADIARNLIVDATDWRQISFSGRRLLPERTLFAASIANLSAIINDARKEFNTSAYGFMGLTDGLRSSVHRDMRVFDFNFGIPQLDKAIFDRRKNTQHPYRWIFLTNGPIPNDFQEGDAFSLTERSSWEMVSTTAMASGAVPLAFPPVVIRRWDYEYGFDRDQGNEDQQGSTWPRNLGNRHSSYNFTFVDGGTFNNEPIREAFRLASFLDSKDHREFVRKIVFVDPFVSEELPPLQVGINQAFSSRDRDSDSAFNSSGKENPFRRASLDKLIPHVGHLVSALLDEGRVIEGDKIFQTRKRFQVREKIQTLILGLAIQKNTQMELSAKEIIALSQATLDTDFLHNLIPVSSPDISVELKKVVLRFQDSLPTINSGDCTLFINDPSSIEMPQFSEWFQALLLLYVDIMMDMTGKSDTAILLAIAPVANFQTRDGHLEAEYMKLGGAPLGGFAGFMSKEAKSSDFIAGRYAAGLYLQTDSNPPVLQYALNHCVPFSAYHPVLISDETIKQGMGRLSKRVTTAIKEAHLINSFPGLNQILEAVAALFVSKMLKKVTGNSLDRQAFEMLISVPDDAFELDGRGIANDYSAQLEAGEDGLWLATVVDCYYSLSVKTPNPLNWKGYHLTEDNLLPIYRNQLLSLADRKVCDLRLPDSAQVSEALQTGATGFACAVLPAHVGQSTPQHITWTLRYARYAKL
jgi:hypothetical protein